MDPVKFTILSLRYNFCALFFQWIPRCRKAGMPEKPAYFGKGWYLTLVGPTLIL